MMPHFSSIWSEAVLMDNDKIVEKHAAQCGASETWERWLWGVIVVLAFHRQAQNLHCHWRVFNCR
jgi:hypothetical protein